MGSQELNVSTIRPELSVLTLLQVLITTEGSEAPVLGNDDLLAAGKFVLRPPQSFNCRCTVIVTSSNGENDLPDINTGDRSVGLSPSSAHTSLKPVRAGTGQHLVDTGDMVGVSTNSHMETILSASLDEVLVGTDTSCLKSLGRELLVLVRDEVHAERELIDAGTLAAQIEDADLGVGNTAIETGLWVRLVLAVTVATSRSASHFVLLYLVCFFSKKSQVCVVIVVA